MGIIVLEKRIIIYFAYFKKILVDPALTGSKTPSQDLERNEKVRWGSTAYKSPIGSGQQDVGPSGVATGRGVFNLSSSISVGDEEKSLLIEFHFIIKTVGEYFDMKNV